MAANLARAGHQVVGFDYSDAAMEKARAASVLPAQNGASAARAAEVVITMLPAGKHLVDAYSGAGGLLSAAKPGTLFIDCSTVDIDSARAAHAEAKAAAMAPVDAPVSGGVGGANNGSLTFIVGGESEAINSAAKILATMGKKIVICGHAGAGQAAKICNNMILGISMIAVSEAFVLGEKLGPSHQALFDVASTSSGQCWSLTSYCPVPGPVPSSPANSDYRPGFAAALMLKDLRLSQAAALSAGAETALGRHATAIYEAFSETYSADSDFSAIINCIRSERERS
jgi:3-hydroxyisobutyrate dehydrogenase